jgi:uncharacterized membrane protein
MPTVSKVDAPRYAPAAVLPSAPVERITSIDVMRGVIMILMAIDHVRVYSGVPAGGPTPGVFFTRWITNFVAPGFAFLAGTSAFLVGRKLGDMRALSRYLVTRGVILVLLELTVLRISWAFNFDYSHYIIAGVIWMLGVCMILMSGLVRFSPKAIGIFGLVTIFAQQLIGLPAQIPAVRTSVGWIFQFLYFGGGVGPIGVLYSIVPWIGVMAAGYAFGTIITKPREERDRLCLRIGLAATALFIIGAGLATALKPATPGSPPALFRFLAQQKYPASQLFLLMTLGPIIALLPLAEKARGWIGNALSVFGRVPMFYYLLHIPLIHALAVVVSLIRTGSVTPWLFGNLPLDPPDQPPGYRWSLALLYLVWAVAIVVLYLPSKWYWRAKAEKRFGWMKYI